MPSKASALVFSSFTQLLWIDPYIYGCRDILQNNFLLIVPQRSNILSYIWTGEDVWPASVCRDFILEWAVDLQNKVQVRDHGNYNWLLGFSHKVRAPYVVFSFDQTLFQLMACFYNMIIVDLFCFFLFSWGLTSTNTSVKSWRRKNGNCTCSACWRQAGSMTWQHTKGRSWTGHGRLKADLR